MSNVIHRFYDNITRKKTYDTESLHTSQLRRCLTVFDLTILGKINYIYLFRKNKLKIIVILGIGSTLGTGTYIITGQVAHETAGPSIILSFLIAAIASILAGNIFIILGLFIDSI